MSYRKDPRDQYYNNGSSNQSGQYREYAGGYQQGQFSNPRMQNDGYRPPIRNPYSTPNQNTKGTRAADDDDNESICSSIYSQPSDAGFTPSNNTRYYQEQSTEPRRRSLTYNDQHPPSFSASTNTRNSAGLTGSSQQGLIDRNENDYMPDNTEENYYQDYSQQDSQAQFDVYNDFNNNFRGDEKHDDEESHNNTLTVPDGAYDPNSYSTNGGFSPSGKGTRQSATAHYVVSKKERKCACCSRKTCVIISFIVLILLAIGLYFVWPRIPGPAESTGTLGNAAFTVDPNNQIEFQFDLDNTANYLPYKFNSLEIDVYDATSVINYNRPVATGVKKGFSIPAKKTSTISVPLTLTQGATVLQNFTSTCTAQSSDIQLNIAMTMFIFGIDWIKKPQASIPLVYLKCPNATNTQPTSATGQPAGATTPAPTPEGGITSAPSLTAAASPAGTTPTPTPTGTTTTGTGTSTTGTATTRTSSSPGTTSSTNTSSNTSSTASATPT